MHPHDIRLGIVIVDNLGSLDDTRRAEISTTLEGQELVDKGPLNKILRLSMMFHQSSGQQTWLE